MPMFSSVQLLAKSRDAKAPAEEDSLQIAKIVMMYFFTALTIEGHCAAEAVFSYTAENSHHLKAQVTSKIRCFKRRKYQ